MDKPHHIVGRLLRASNRGFTFGCRLTESDTPFLNGAPLGNGVLFGSLVHAQAQAGQTKVYGLVYDIQVTDDGLVRQLSIADELLLSEPRPDERHHRAAPNEVSVLTVGYLRGDVLRYGPAPQPPLSLDAIYPCTLDEVCLFTARWDWLKLVLDTREVPADDLLVAALLLAAEARPAEDQRPYLLRAGRELARLMASDTLRLEALLKRLKPGP
jgi:hypothetical protein